MNIGIPREIKTGETRVATTPSVCRRLTSLGASVLVEKRAGVRAGFADADYRSAGATIVGSAERLWRSADVIL